jgi:hypothetical protein
MRGLKKTDGCQKLTLLLMANTKTLYWILTNDFIICLTLPLMMLLISSLTHLLKNVLGVEQFLFKELSKLAYSLLLYSLHHSR